MQNACKILLRLNHDEEPSLQLHWQRLSAPYLAGVPTASYAKNCLADGDKGIGTR